VSRHTAVAGNAVRPPAEPPGPPGDVDGRVDGGGELLGPGGTNPEHPDNPPSVDLRGSSGSGHLHPGHAGYNAIADSVDLTSLAALADDDTLRGQVA
jgi:hypothetical protein